MFYQQIDSSVENVVAYVSDGVITLSQVLLSVRDKGTKKAGEALKVAECGGVMSEASRAEKGGKLDAAFFCPYIFSAITEKKSVDLVGDGGGLVFPKIKVDHLTPFREEAPRIPQKLGPAAAAPPVAATAAPAAATVIPAPPPSPAAPAALLHVQKKTA